MRRDNDKYQFKEPFGRDIRKKMIESQKKVLQGPEKHLKLGQLKPTMLATVGHVATGVIQPEKKQQAPKTDKKEAKEKKKKAKKQKRKKTDKKSESADEQPVEKKGKKEKGDSKMTKPKQISNISLEDFDNIRNHFPGWSLKCSRLLFGS